MLDHAHSYVTGQAFGSIFLCLLKFGVHGFVEMMNKEAFKMYMGSSSHSVYRHMGLNHKIRTMVKQEGLKDVSEFAGCNKQGNFIFIKQIKETKKKGG